MFSFLWPERRVCVCVCMCFPYRHISFTVRMLKERLLNGEKRQMYFDDKDISDRKVKNCECETMNEPLKNKHCRKKNKKYKSGCSIFFFLDQFL